MKRKMNFARISRTVAFMSLIFFASFAAARAQTVVPHFDCTEPVYTNGTLTQLRAYFGYENTTNANIVIGDGPNSFFSPNPGGSYSGQQTFIFLPGYHQRSFFITVTYPREVTWFLNNLPANLDRTWAGYCSSGKMTYQGRLTSGSAAASGQYDLQFDLYDQLTDGTSRGIIRQDSVTVTNGVFTASLDVGTVFKETSDAAFLEIGVKRAGDPNPYTILTPRQPLTVAPFALKAKTAFDVRIPFIANPPTNAECNTETLGQMKLRFVVNATLYVCTPGGWKSTTMQ